MIEYWAWTIGTWVVLLLILAIVLRALLLKPESKFRRVYDGIELFDDPKPGLVYFEFHTYDGLLLWFTQTKHAGFATLDDARKLLRRLNHYNLTFGLLAAGGIFVPILTLVEYRRQLRSLVKQTRNGKAHQLSTKQIVASEDKIDSGIAPSNTNSIGGFFRFLNAVGASFLPGSVSILLAIGLVVNLYEGRMTIMQSLPGLAITIVIASFAWDWYRKGVRSLR